MKRIKYLIIGAGPTGLGAAYRLKDAGERDYLILEGGNFVGGLATSFVDPKGFTWDVGGHVQFSHYPYFDRVMQEAIPAAEWLHHQRESWVWIRERFVPYPFQNNIRYLPREAMWECLKGLIEVAGSPRAHKPKNFEEWILASFGSGVADEFMRPYNFKVWAFPPSQLGYQWIGDRVATVDLARILQNVIFEKMDASWGPNNTFQFPLRGGTGAIWKNVAKSVGLEKIRLGAAVKAVDSGSRTVTLKSGEILQYENILSTMPLDKFVRMLKGASAEAKQRVRGLKFSTSNIIGVGIHGTAPAAISKKCWMYFPESTTPFYRVTVFSNYSPKNVPGPDYYSLMCEVSESDAKPVNQRALIADTVSGLKLCGFIDARARVVSTWKYRAGYGYPTPSLERDEILAAVIPELDALGAFSRGRFGGWKYEVSNQDHSFMQGVEWSDRILSGAQETTYRVDSSEDPNVTRLKALKTAEPAKVAA